MATVTFKRGSNTEMKNTPKFDGMLYFNETNNKIYMDVGNDRLQFGGDTTLVGTLAEASNDNTLNGEAIKTLFLAKTNVIDNYTLATTTINSQTPVGCLAFKDLSQRTQKVTHYTLASGTWSSTTTTVNGKAYYTYTLNVGHIYSTLPDIVLSASGTLPTEAQRDAYNEIFGATFNTSNATIKFYSPSRPSVNIDIDVKGVG